MSKLVAYFSATGTTKARAEKKAQELGADTYEIKPTEAYTSADLDWKNEESRSSVEMKGDIKPEIVTGDIDISAYDTIYIGYPVWWYRAPTIINSFLASYDFAGKKIVLFATSGSTKDFGETIARLQPDAPGAMFEESEIYNSY